MTDQEIINRLQEAEEDDRVPFPDERFVYRAFRLHRFVCPDKRLYLMTQEHYELCRKLNESGWHSIIGEAPKVQ